MVSHYLIYCAHSAPDGTKEQKDNFGIEDGAKNQNIDVLMPTTDKMGEITRYERTSFQLRISAKE